MEISWPIPILTISSTEDGDNFRPDVGRISGLRKIDRGISTRIEDYSFDQPTYNKALCCRRFGVPSVVFNCILEELSLEFPEPCRTLTNAAGCFGIPAPIKLLV